MAERRLIPDIEYEVALLQYIRTKGDVRPFLKASGNDTKKLFIVVEKLLSCGYVCKDDKRLMLSEKGCGYLAALNKQLGRKGLYGCFLPDYSSRRVQMSIADTYIPKYMFKRGGGHFSNSYVLGRSDESSGDEESTFKHDK